MPVAKTYQKYNIVSEPYSHNNRMYVKIDKQGVEKEVRWYTEKEYLRMYGEESLQCDSVYDQKSALGFTDGYITVFQGDQEAYQFWFKQSIARYAKWWGWYLVSGDEIPTDLPADLKPVKLLWSDVGLNDKILKPDSSLKPFVDSLLYGVSESSAIGEIGDRLELELRVEKAITFDGAYGNTIMHIFHDASGNEFKWTTSAKQLTIGSVYKIRGTVKEHTNYHGITQTVLTRCKAELL